MQYFQTRLHPIPTREPEFDTKTCWRCGVEFDPALFKRDAPCPDCQLDVPGDWLLKTSTRGRLNKEEGALRDAEIKRLNALNWLDTEIAEELGIHPSTVGYRRNKMGIPPVSTIVRPERYQWKDVHAYFENAKTLVYKREKSTRGRKVQ